MKKIFFLMTVGILISSCHFYYTQAYLLRHPQQLQIEVEKCEGQTPLSAYCDLIQHTSRQLAEDISLRQEDPLKFGMLILQMQTEMQAAKERNEPEVYYSLAHKLEYMFAAVAAVGPVD